MSRCRIGWRLVGLVTATVLVATPHAAVAYTVKNIFARGCHEEITTEALRAVRGELATAAPLPATSDEQALIADLQFTPDSDMMDLGAATLLAAVRDNDLKGRSSEDFTQLAAVHGNPDSQEEHCLRSQDEDEPGGSASAVAACRTFIRARILEALEGLDATGNPDPTKRTSFTVHLSVRGGVDAPLPTYYVKMGLAIHAIEDSFSHSYRTADGRQITVTLNWIDKANGALVEPRDGPPHVSDLDRCDNPDALRTTRRELAFEAARAVLRATLDPAKTPDEKMAAVDAALDELLTYSPGCTFANGWCDAPERQYGDSGGCGCHVGELRGGSAPTLAGVVAALMALARRRRRAPRRVPVALTLTGAVLLAPSEARAQPTTITTPTTPTAKNEHAPPAPTVIPVKEPGPRDPSAMAWGAALGGAGAIDNPALAGSVGVRLRVSKHWMFGLDGEWNPWLALNGTTAHAGAINVYGSAMLRFPLAYDNFNLRITASAGASYLLTNLYGAPTGSVGPYAGASFLGVEWKLSRAFFLVINPVSIAVPVPQTKAIPFAYPQYRFALAIEAYLG